MTLAQNFLYYKRKVAFFRFVFRLVEIHEDRNEGSLPVGGKQRHYLVLYGLHAAAYFFAQSFFGKFVDFFFRRFCAQGFGFGNYVAANLFPADVDERRKMSKRYRLTAVLV